LSRAKPNKRRRNFRMVDQKCCYLIMKANPEFLDQFESLRVTEKAKERTLEFVGCRA